MTTRTFVSIPLLFLLWSCQRGTAPPAFENLLVIVIDTLRSDHVPAYGYGRDTAPFLSRLASCARRVQE